MPRRSLRMPGFDYAHAGAYFVTICTHGREHSLAAINDGVLELTEAGKIVSTLWFSLTDRFPFVVLDAFVVMPNHMHGIIILNDPGPSGREHVARPLGQVIRAFKGASTQSIRGTADPAFAWQLDYHDHVVRSTYELQRIREYIEANPSRWGEDPENPSVTDLFRGREPWEV